MSDPYEAKFRELKNYIPFLEDKIDQIKKAKLRFNYPDEERERKLTVYQTLHKALLNREGRRLKLDTLEAFERKLKKISDQDQAERYKENVNRRDPNPLHNPGATRPGRSFSPANGSSTSNHSSFPPKKPVEDGPASPSPPSSPPAYSKTISNPIIIPTDRHLDSPPRIRRYKSPSPPGPTIPNIIPIARVNVRDQRPKEWDSDEEQDDSPKSRPKIIIPTVGILKKTNNVQKKDEPNRWDPDFDNKRQNSMANLPTVQVNELEGSRRLSSVLEKSNLLSEAGRIVFPSRSPLTNVPEAGLRSPDPDLFGRQVPPLPMSRSEPMGAPRTPSLLLNAPTTNTRPIALADIAEFLDDSDCNNLRSREHSLAAKHPSIVPKPVSGIGLPDILRPEKTIPPLTDPRLANDPRSRISSADPRSQGSTIPNELRTMPLHDPRSHASTVPRFPSDTTRPDMIPPGEFHRSRHYDQYGQDSSVMGRSPMHGIPGPGPPSGYPSAVSQMGPRSQMNYDYRMGQQSQSASQQWNSGHTGMMSTPQPVPPPSNAYSMGPQTPGMRSNVPDQSGWQNSAMHHTMMNGDSRVPPSSYPNQMTNMVPRQNTPHIQPLLNVGGAYNPQNKYPSYHDRSYNSSYDQQQQQQQPSNDYRRQTWNGPSHGSSQGPSNDPRSFNRPYGQPHNNWNNKNDSVLIRPNRDPRMQRNDGPQLQPPLSTQRISSPPKALQPVQPVKEVHSNKFNKPKEPETESEMKQRFNKMRMEEKKKNDKKDKLKEKSKDLEKAKERSKDSDKSKEKSKDSDKVKDKKKNSEKSSKSQVSSLYGTIDAKKAVQGSGLNKFKIPKKRPSVEVQPEQPDSSEPIAEEENWDDDVEGPVTPEPEPEPEPMKKSSEKHVKNKHSKKKEVKKSENDIKQQSLKDQINELYKLSLTNATIKHLYDQLVEELAKMEKEKELEKSGKDKEKRPKNIIVYSSEEDEEATINTEQPSLSMVSKKKKKKPAIQDSSPDESSETESTQKAKPKIIKNRKLSSELKVSIGKLNVNELKKKGKLKNINLGEKEQPVEDTIENEPDSVSETTNVSDKVIDDAEVLKKATPPAKPGKKRRNRELEVLQEDLKASWMCDGLMNTTSVRTCSQKNKTQDQPENQVEDHAKAGKPKKVPGPKSKTKAKKPAAEVAPENSESEDDNSSVSSRNDQTTNSKPKKISNKKVKSKSTAKMPPPLFDDSSNEDFNLDVSAVEPSSDISLHPESSDKFNKTKKKTKEAADEAEESSSDESFVSNSSSLLLDSAGKPRDSNEELLEDVMHQLSANPKYSRAKKKQVKKKRSAWQNGVVGSRRRKKKVNQNKNGESSAQNTSATNEDASNKENDSSLQKSNLRLSTESLDEESIRNRNANAQDNEDITSRVDPEALIQYTLSEGNEKKQCLLCPFYFKNIVQHYKTSHPRKEVLISRLPLENSKLAIEESKIVDPDTNTSEDQGDFNCRFCMFTTHGKTNYAKESFYEHLTSHTGEYRFMCRPCGYMCGSKNSVKSHYYKECKKSSSLKNVNEAIREDVIPSENKVYGYMCSKCHFLQLKKENVEMHIDLWHKKSLIEVDIIKIDMSLKIKGEVKNEDVGETKDEKFIDTKDDIFVGDRKNDTVKADADDTKDDVTVKIASIAQKDSEISVLFEVTEHKQEKKDNMSAFVCASEVDENELEIQNERKKKMEEIAANIGIKTNKTETQKRLSIIDQLQDKISSLPEDDGVSENQPQDSTDPLHISEFLNKDDEREESTEALNFKADPDTADDQSQDTSDAKLRDPLAFDETNKPDTEQSNSPIVPPVHYESESSAGSDDENTDVSSILKQSTDGDVPAQTDRMLTTIQRLAAQIHNNKQSAIDTSSLPEAHPKTIVADMPPVKIKTEKISPDKSDPESSNIIMSPTKIKTEVKNEPLSPSEMKSEEDETTVVNSENMETPKKFIRVRRISGDYLSKGNEEEANDEQIPVEKSESEPNSGFIRIESVMSLAENENQKVSKVTGSKELSPKLIKGQSILKPSQYIIQRPDGTVSVMTSPHPITSVMGGKVFSLNMPSSRASTAKPENVISIAGQQAVSIKIDGNSIPLSMVSTTGGPIPSPISPVKYIKVLPSSEMSAITAVKLKSAEVYEKMLKDDKLIHLYKCMGRDCCFTTSNEVAFQKHLKLHEDDLKINGESDGPKDYLKCAYCYVDSKNFKDLFIHLKSTHTFCRYCCKYCFYRGFAQSYVELHQKTYHSLKPTLVLIVSEELVTIPPSSKRLDRKTVIKPYVCEHDCNKYFFIPEAFTLHLNMHHPNLKNSYKCHTCKQFISSVEELISHYKVHGYFKYHCLYCVHGAAKMNELHVHLSSSHYNQPPEILERCLPREISKNLSAIEQLKIHDVDKIYFQKKPHSEEESLKVAIPPLSKVNDSFVPISSIAGNVSNIRIVDSRSLNSPGMGGKVINISQNMQMTVPTLNTKKGNSATNSNEIVNSDLLPKLKSSVRDDSDSDIEIIEEKTNVPNNVNKNKEASKNQIKEEIHQESSVLQCSQSLNSSLPSNQASSETSNVSCRFLTLEDIKDTGLCGPELFRCGSMNCIFAANTKDELNLHMKQCSPVGEEECADTITALHCPHCNKKFGKVNFYMDHLKTHGLKRFKCALCESKFALQSQAQTHLRTKHKFTSSKVVAADPTNPIVDGLFIVHPLTAAEKNKNKKLAKSPVKDANLFEVEKTVFSPNEIEKLPLQSIFLRDVQCKICPFKTKVKTNMIRHLQAHLNDEKVPDASPVNPVPCLDKKERMFDKMVNLASSSHENGRMGFFANTKEKLKNEEQDYLPKFVPEHRRYVCGVPECNYLTVEEAMLRHHIKALHSDEPYYKCPHCTTPNEQEQAQSIPLDKMGNHFKMHDCRLFKCSYCIYYHYQRHVVERHMMDKHSDKPSFVKVIRDQQATPDNQPSASVTQEPEEKEMPDPDGNTWKCCLCDFRSIYKQAMQNHALSSHGEKNQFQCHCGYKAISKVTFDQHLQQKHPGDTNVDFITIYKRIKSLKKPEFVEPLVPQGEPFDTTPLWSRGRIGVRHIRGILVEEEEEVETTRSPTKRKLDTAKSKDSKIDIKKIKLSTEDPLKIPDSYGPFGDPLKDMFACPMCQFKSKNKGDFKEHLNRELKYYKWYCPMCDYTGVNRRVVAKHCNKNHLAENCEPVEAASDEKIEKWVLETIIHQSEIMKSVKKAENSEEDEAPSDLKEEEFKGDTDEDKTSHESLPEPLKCKHCDESFVKWRGFKRHVQLMHLKRLGFCCPYCDQSTNSEARMMQHVRSKHAGLPEKVIENQNTKTKDLTDEFWEKEYGLVIPKRPSTKKRKRRDDELSKVEIEHPCDQCDYVSSTSADLKVHLKIHEMKVRHQCLYCSFQTFSSSEIRHHWEVNHPQREFMIEEAFVTPAAMEVANHLAMKKNKAEDEKKSTVYYCYYCNLGSTNLDTIRKHWKTMHKKESSPIFKYKEHSENTVRCGYCAEAGTMTMLASHIKQTHGKNKETILVEKEEDGWLCKYSNEQRCKKEFIHTKEEMDNHHKSFHPFSTLNFKLTHRTFKCKECNLDLPTLETIQKHAKIHVNLHKCKHCSKNFKNFAFVKQHFALSHPEFEAEARTMTPDDVNMEIEEIVEKSTIYSDLKLMPVTVTAPYIKSPPTSPRIAKKSTTKQLITSPRKPIPIKPFPQKIRAVARKSTNPLPRYPPGIVFETSENQEYVSYYKKPIQSVDLSKIHVEMAVGGLKKKISCSILKTMFGIDIDAKMSISDCMKETNE